MVHSEPWRGFLQQTVNNITDCSYSLQIPTDVLMWMCSRFPTDVVAKIQVTFAQWPDEELFLRLYTSISSLYTRLLLVRSAQRRNALIGLFSSIRRCPLVVIYIEHNWRKMFAVIHEKMHQLWHIVHEESGAFKQKVVQELRCRWEDYMPTRVHVLINTLAVRFSLIYKESE